MVSQTPAVNRPLQGREGNRILVGVWGEGQLVVYLGLPPLLQGMVSYSHALEEAVPRGSICVVVRSDRYGGEWWGWEGRVEAESSEVCFLGQ